MMDMEKCPAFQAVATALAATVGTGNIAELHWQLPLVDREPSFGYWISAFFGMATKFSEVVLAIVYREKMKMEVSPVDRCIISKPELKCLG